MNWQIHNIFGWFHVLTGSLAVITALFIMFSKKGTRRHKQMGYVYAVSMVILNGSAWGVMEFFPGKPGPFHFGALVSLIFLFLGMYPVITRGKNWLQRHYNYISGSIIGLFAAFFVEAVFRSFSGYSVIILLSLGISTAVALAGTILIRKNRPNYTPVKKVVVE